MLTSILFLLACDDTDAPGPAGASSSLSAGSVYGACASASQNVVTAEELGEPVSILVEFETPNGWVPVGFEPAPSITSAPTVRRTDEDGIWLECPDSGVSGWHVAWVSAR